MMEIRIVFLLGVVGALLAWGVLVGLYIWPRLRALSRPEALRILTLPHTFRFVGLGFLVPGVASPLLSSAFSFPAAWGDFGALILAFVTIAALTKHWSFAIPLVWLLNLWGTIDLLNGYYQGIANNVNPGAFGATYYLPTLFVPLLLVTHIMAFMLLLRRSES